MLARNWECGAICKLCDQEAEIAVHPCLQCSYAKEVWMLNIWKERNRRIFEGKSLRPVQVFDMIQDDVKLR
uniref:Reverse transcriptase zinc-binding domain-containing protein n=1 Tax=Setaria italica TaxID=4555 RepID=K4AI54_SETIT